MTKSPITTLPSIGPTQAKKFAQLGITTIEDLLWFFPSRHIDFSQTSSIGEVKPGVNVTLRGVVKSVNAPYAFRGRIRRTETILSDETGSIKIVWFNQPYLAKYFNSGDEIAVAGKVGYYKNVMQVQNPIFEKLDTENNLHTGKIIPLYKGSGKVSNKIIRKTIASALSYVSEIEEILPSFITKKFGLTSLPEALANIHFPENTEFLEQAKNRFAFDELLNQQLANKLQQSQATRKLAPVIELQTEAIKQKVDELPFKLTAGQKRAVWDIMQDIAEQQPMVRLIQGDVGSGKTLVAVLASLDAVLAGWQVAVIAPTEILATQHYEYFKKFLPECSVGLLTQNLAKLPGNANKTTEAKLSAVKNKVIEKIASGEIQIIIGTHALLQKNIAFGKLGLVIIDEQHRFGVKQRAIMLEQTQFNGLTPHLMSMSATPIPRTLALTFNGNLKLSTLTTIPTGKKNITTSLVADADRAGIYKKIAQAVAKGEQAFIVTPRVEDTDNSELKSVKQEFATLQSEVFPHIPMGLLYGTMKGADKEGVMNRFSKGEFKILVATSVIEIGIDIPQASFIIIEDAERFGLAQLHQLRGRVGRAGQKSYCFLFSSTSDATSIARLELFCDSLDGFALAEKDLEQRGFGNLFGTEQSGFPFEYSDYFTIATMKDSQVAANLLIEKSANLDAYPQLKSRAEKLIELSHQE